MSTESLNRIFWVVVIVCFAVLPALVIATGVVLQIRRNRRRIRARSELRSEDPAKRLAAVSCMGEQGPHSSDDVEALIKTMLTDASTAVRVGAASALGRIQRELLTIYPRSLPGSEVPGPQEPSREELVKFVTGTIVPALLRALNQENQELYDAAAVALVRRRIISEENGGVFRHAGGDFRRDFRADLSDAVDCTVFSPRAVKANEMFLVQVYAHIPERARLAATLARKADIETNRLGFRSLDLEIRRGTRLAFTLRIPGFKVDQPVQHLLWRGRTEAVQFGITVPDQQEPGSVVGSVNVIYNSIPVGHIRFKLDIKPSSDRDTAKDAGPTGYEARRYSMAFVSYASADRAKVLARVQMLRVLGIRYFQDLLHLEPGDRWEKKLYRYIDEADLFLLFWSSAARDSEWVLREVRYALARKGGDDFAPPDIHPIILALLTSSWV